MSLQLASFYCAVMAAFGSSAQSNSVAESYQGFDALRGTLKNIVRWAPFSRFAEQPSPLRRLYRLKRLPFF